MAIVRCQDHPPQSPNYRIAIKPVGFPDTALMCGRDGNGHTEPGWVYLRADELGEYRDGKRVFNLWGPESNSIAAKVRVGDEPVQGLEEWEDLPEDESPHFLLSQSEIGGFDAT